jgi:hypothetical protein
LFTLKGGDAIMNVISRKEVSFMKKYFQELLLNRLNEEQNKLNYFGSLLISILKTNDSYQTKSLIELFDDITDSLSNAYVAILNCYNPVLLEEAVHIVNEVSFMVASFGGTVQKLEEIC